MRQKEAKRMILAVLLLRKSLRGLQWRERMMIVQDPLE